ncbi:hypothetical protein CPB83DRAFT_860067 [Crepidotus variabilis]|uniref:Uncharacterized protein n=1 Tax=Crepidotus variabilis TaxID=179855 RepID=A0A9P6JLZ0_9AGAR|nr:hypothetical protein CPB83DRAFT_860067 [Crepidotus variabilis]
MKPSTIASRFKQLPRDSALAQFMSRHDDGHGFITRLDRSPASSKRLTFAKALAMNICIFLFVTALAFVAIHKSLVGPQPSQHRLAVLVTEDVLLFAAILVILRSTTVPFFFGECRLRFQHGFQASEIVIRRPPTTASSSLPSNNKTVGEDQRMERSWRMAIHAINPQLLYSSAGAILSSDYWTMEYTAVFDALQCIAAGEFSDEDLEFAVFRKDNTNGIWSVCELWRMHEIMCDQQEIIMFKTFLTASGKQELLNIWQEMLSTSSVERSPSPKAYQVMTEKFAREGLDYEAIWSQVTENSTGPISL